MKLLRETIRNLIRESQDSCGNLNDVLQGAINQMAEHDLEIVTYNTGTKMQIVLRRVGTAGSDKVGILKATTDPWTLEGECWGGFMVSWATVAPSMRGTGLGALLYDVALELAEGNGLMADRTSVTKEAWRNWSYFSKSNDYWKKPLDNIDGDYTPDEATDDCASGSHYEHGGNEDNFQSHPLNQVVVKKDQSKPTHECLRRMGRIRVKGT